MPFLTLRSAVLAKIESVEGTNSVPAAANDAIVTVGNTTVGLNPDELDRGISNPSLSKWGFVVGMKDETVTFSTELKGPGRSISAASPLREDPLFRACGMYPTYATSSCVYKFATSLASASQSATCTIYAWQDGILHILKGCRGSFDLDLSDGQFGKINWEFKGIYDTIPSGANAGDIEDNAIPFATIAYDALTEVPAPFMDVEFSLHGYSAVAQQLTLKVDNNVQRREGFIASNGIVGQIITERTITGTINPEAVPRTTHDYFYNHQTAAQSPLYLLFGKSPSAWTTIQVDAPKTQYRAPKYGDRNGVKTFDIDFVCARSASGGDDEFSLMYKWF